MSSAAQLAVIRPPRGPIPRPTQVNLRGLLAAELEAFVARELGGPRFRAQQVFDWIHGRAATSFQQMSNLGKAQRAHLESVASVDPLSVEHVARSHDGTRKLRLRTPDGHAIESVLIPNDERGYTLCVSSQVGCALSCRFCATATLTYQRHLATWEIVDQVYRSATLLRDESEDPQYAPRITNLVFMGMGEPLLNYNQLRPAIDLLTDARGLGLAGRRITVSTAGVVPAIERFANDGLGDKVGLAISLNATTDAVRDEVMPINRRWPIRVLLDAVERVPVDRRRDITFEYVLLDGVNDHLDDAERLAALLRGFRCHVNVIPFNPHPQAAYGRPSPARIAAFVERLRAHDTAVYLRTPRGDDIGAACGQLALQADGHGT